MNEKPIDIEALEMEWHEAEAQRIVGSFNTRCEWCWKCDDKPKTLVMQGGHEGWVHNDGCLSEFNEEG